MLEQNGKMLARYNIDDDVQTRSGKISQGTLTTGLQLALSGSSRDRPEYDTKARLEKRKRNAQIISKFLRAIGDMPPAYLVSAVRLRV